MMPACKFYRQGNCRNGQYCQYEHYSSFVNVNNINDENKTAVVIAREVLCAEMGGQWLLSCFAPFRDRPTIPGMEDVSPEEVRWEMYQAQKNGVVEQAKLRFQQLCQDMQTKREALKYPTQETLEMLKKLLGNRFNNGTSDMSNFSFANSQMLINISTTTNVFGTETFVNQNNTFGQGFGSVNNNPSPFTRTNNSVSLFGASSTFGNNALTFPNVTNSNSVFGGTTNTPVFGNGQNNQAFGTVANNSIFGAATSQAIFGQPSNFGTTTQTTNVFARPSTSQQTTTSVFDSGTVVPSNSLFYTPQSNTSLFGENKPSTNGPFGESSAIQTSNSIFGGSTTSSGNMSTNSTSIFGQSKTTTVFGGTPAFGANAGSFTNNSSPSIFGGQTFNKDTQVPSDNIFGRFIASSNFVPASQGTNVFNVTKTTSNVGNFGVPQNALAVMPATNTASFASAATTTSVAPFGTVNSQTDTKSTTYAIARPTFGITNATNPLSNTVTSSTMPFGVTTGTSFNGNTNITSSPFIVPTFGGFTSSFMQTSTTATTTTTNPFISQQTNSPFNGAAHNQIGTVNESLVANQSNEKSLFSFAQKTTPTDDITYSEELQLTDEEKIMYLANEFIVGKIPLKPPSNNMI
ncbi:PREDICTED: nuclear pore complex protein NUP98A-like isoform X1 [Polistes canadensis]|uniref:nuclear pore complex protein NUP98A-like isoform X1 n=1 Tax=Polistes canadensis TaxID=91411 RepID=UPI000718FA50|nr:PREDICTED: nuclear pore complex protein NUP98A-like isoform X1 [Polistes canadensis]XP_014597901.1 PREDICTED: nuclear pore complex protein NUP98A-like isoform X1 [Polistes canadensis]